MRAGKIKWLNTIAMFCAMLLFSCTNKSNESAPLFTLLGNTGIKFTNNVVDNDVELTTPRFQPRDGSHTPGSFHHLAPKS